jgi:hypothetical protein
MRFFLIGLGIGIAVLLFVFGIGLGSKAEQPIAFNHKKHLEQGTECITCHANSKEQTFSGMPTVKTCMECHKDPLTQNPQEKKIRELHKKGQGIPWKRIYEQPDHVFFSHRRHVVLGKIECQGCHGDIGQSKRPPSKPWVKMTMNWCMDCHAKSKVTNDCLACHV